jgi:CHAT domain-containing protein
MIERIDLVRTYLLVILLLTSISATSEVNHNAEIVSELVNATTEDLPALLNQKYKDLSISEIRPAFRKQIEDLKNNNDYKSAMKASTVLLKISEIRNDPESAATANHSIGIIHEIEGRKEDALKSFTESLKLSETIGYQKGIAISLERIGNIKKDWAQYEEALQDLNRSLEIHRSINDKPGIADSLSTIADVYGDQLSYEKSLEIQQQSLNLREEMGDPVEIGKSQVRIGNVYGAMGRADLALRHWEIAVQLFENAGSKGRLSGVYNNIANAVTGYGNWGLGLQYYLKSLKGCEEVGSKQCMAFPILNIGVLHEAHGNYQLALDYYKRAHQLFQETGMKAVAMIAQANIAGAYALLGQHNEALNQYREILKTKEERGEDTGGVFGAMAAVYELKGEYKTALVFCEKSLERHKILKENYWVMDKTLMMSRLHRALKQSNEALSFAKVAIHLANELGDPETLWAAQLEEGRAYKELGDQEKAVADFQEAIRLIEHLRTQVATSEWESQQYFQSRTDPYYEMIQSLVLQDKTMEALNYAELYKSRVLLDVLGNGKINVTKDMTPQEKEQEQSLRSSLVSLNSQLLSAKSNLNVDLKKVTDLENKLQKARLNLDSFRTNLYAVHPRLNIHRGQLNAQSFEKAVEVVNKKSILFEYVVAEEQSILFVVSRKNEDIPIVRMYTIHVSRDRLSQLVQRFRKQLAEQDPGFRALSKQLYRMLIKPAEAEFTRNTDSIIVVPDRDLWELPFQALLDSQNRYLLQKGAVSYAQSMTVLHEMINLQPNQSSSTTLLAFANPQIASETSDRLKSFRSEETFYPLPEAERNVKSLATLYGSKNSLTVTGINATEEVFKKEANGFDVIHIAAHGFISDSDPMYSHLILAKGSKKEDGLLEPWEVLDMNLNASLIVLSACETARGKVSSGEGMIGFTWAFFVAGTPSTIVSQWKVDAVSTTQLMNEFHLNWRRNGMTKAESLRRAALKVMATQEFSHPFSWAGFVLIGDPR